MRIQRRFITRIALGGWFDLCDLFMMAYIGAALQDSGFLTLHQFTLAIAAGFAGMFVGTVSPGWASDKFGRRTSFVFTLVLSSLFTAIIGALLERGAPLVFVFIAAAMIGAALVIALW